MRSNELAQDIELSTGDFSEAMATTGDQIVGFPTIGADLSEIQELGRQIQTSAMDGNLYLKKGILLSRFTIHHQQAITIFSYGFLMDPINAQLYRWRGHKHLNVRVLNEGCADLEMVIRLDHDGRDSWNQHGQGIFLGHDSARAEAAYRRWRAITYVNDNNKTIAITDWLYTSPMREGKSAAACHF